MNLGLNERVALVTGASRGLGRASAEALLAEGAKLVVVARPSAELDQLAALDSERCLAIAGDLLDPALPQQVVAATLERFGRLDIAIVNTPGPRSQLPLEVDEADVARAFDATFYPAFRLVQAVRTPMQEQKWGRILIVSSTSVKAPKPFLSLSAAARSALWAWAKSAAPKLYESGITINALFAGPHDTGRARELGVKDRVIGRPEDFGHLTASLCAEATRFVTGTGVILDGGELIGI